MSKIILSSNKTITFLPFKFHILDIHKYLHIKNKKISFKQMMMNDDKLMINDRLMCVNNGYE